MSALCRHYQVFDFASFLGWIFKDWYGLFLVVAEAKDFMTQDALKNYLVEEFVRVQKLFSTKHREGFGSSYGLAEWFCKQVVQQKFKCHYCEVSIFDIKRLIAHGLLRTRKTGYGCRGPVLEIDRRINANGYRQENCALSCYYCNNDKSYISDDEAYKFYYGEARRKHFEDLLKRLN